MDRRSPREGPDLRPTVRFTQSPETNKGSLRKGIEPRREIVFLSKDDPSAAWDQLQIVILKHDEELDTSASQHDEL